jgi:prephenate dehydratase
MNGIPLTQLGYLGPEGSHSSRAAKTLMAFLGLANVTLTPFPSLPQLMAAVETEAIPYAVLPYENALEGSVVEVLETLGRQKRLLYPLGEMLLPVRHCLIQKTPGPVEKILSIPIAYAQCRETLSRLYGWEPRLEATPSTSEAVYRLAGLEDATGWAAIGTASAAQANGLAIVHDNISDAPDNLTRFLLVSAKPEPPVNLATFDWSAYPQKTSICVSLVERIGVLADFLTIFKAHGVNLTKIESRPSRRGYGEYLFHMDMEGDIDTASGGVLRQELLRHTVEYYQLGPYPVLGRLEFQEMDVARFS